MSEKRIKRKMHPNSLKNLRPFPPGTNGNRNPGYSLTQALKDALRQGGMTQKPPADAPAWRHIVYSTLQGAYKREPTPFREVWDRLEGKVPEQHQVDVTERRATFLFILPDGREMTLKELGDGSSDN